MAVTTKDVHEVAELARLRFSPAEEERLAGELNRILQYMDKLNELDTAGVEPTSHVLPLANEFRRDEAKPFSAAGAIVAAAPQRQGDYFKVPRLID